MLVIIDTYSRWLDVKIMSITTAQKLIEILRSIFAYFGFPHAIVADNGPPFNADALRNFYTNHKITYTSIRHHTTHNQMVGQSVQFARSKIL